MHSTTQSQHPDALEQMTNEQLQEILKSDWNREDCSDQERIYRVLTILEERKQGTSSSQEDTDAAWKQFCTHYRTPEGQGRSVYPHEIEALPKKNSRLWFRIAAAAAVLCLILTAVPPAMGSENIFQLLVQWTKTILKTESSGNVPSAPGVFALDYSTDNPELTELLSTIVPYTITTPVLPESIPERFHKTEYHVAETPMYTRVHALFDSSEGSLIIEYLIYFHQDAPTQYYEKDDAQVLTVSLGGNTHYFFTNDGNPMCVWTVGNIECSIGGSVTQDELMQMIRSIYSSAE